MCYRPSPSDFINARSIRDGGDEGRPGQSQQGGVNVSTLRMLLFFFFFFFKRNKVTGTNLDIQEGLTCAQIVHGEDCSAHSTLRDQLRLSNSTIPQEHACTPDTRKIYAYSLRVIIGQCTGRAALRRSPRHSILVGLCKRRHEYGN